MKSTFRFNGAAVREFSAAANSNSLPIITVGSQPRTDSGERFAGDIAVIQIYSGTLSSTQIQGIQSAFKECPTAPSGYYVV